MGKRNIILGIGIAFMISGCAVIRPGEAGVKTTLGKVDETVLMQGAKAYSLYYQNNKITYSH